jgi:hypothetical protein
MSAPTQNQKSESGMRLDSRLLVLVFAFLALGGAGWRQSRLSRNIAELREANLDLRRASNTRPVSGRSGLEKESEADRSSGRRDAEALGGEDALREVNTLRETVAELRITQASLRQELAEALRAMQEQNARALVLQPFTQFELDPERVTKGPRWSPEQLAGPPDTHQAADLPTAWASQEPDGGVEWLQLEYDQAVELAEVRVHESFNPGAISKVAAVDPGGAEVVIWEGTMEQQEGSVESVFEVPPGVRGSSIRLYLDTTRVPGWNEIDAVEVVGRDASRQWANGAQASSYYGEGLDGLGRIESLGGYRLE